MKLWLSVLVLTAGLALAFGKDEIDLDAFGGDPVVSAEIGATPQMSRSDPETDFPTLNTCRQEGVHPTECSQECLFGCESPICSMSCLCACTSPEEKSSLVTILRQEMREINLLAVQTDMWKAGAIGLEARGEKVASGKNNRQRQMPAASLKGQASSEVNVETKAAVRNPRFQRHLQQKKQTQTVQQRNLMMKALAYNVLMKQEALKAQKQAKAKAEAGLTDPKGFDWNKLQDNAGKKDPAMTALGRESDKIDDVYDPTEDPDNIGPDDANAKKNSQWWSEDSLKGSKLGDQWWQHGGETGMTG